MSTPTQVQRPASRRRARWLAPTVVISVIALTWISAGIWTVESRAPCHTGLVGTVSPLPASAPPQKTVELLTQAINGGMDASALFAQNEQAQGLLQPGLLQPSYVGNICAMTVTEYGPTDYESEPNGDFVTGVPITLHWVLKAPIEDQSANPLYLSTCN